MKRLITDNTGPKGELDTDAVHIAILQYRNTPDPDTKISPAMCVFGRPTCDFIPIIPGKYRPHETWRETLKAREEALRKRHVRTAETWAEHTKRLPPLAVGDLVRVQNQTGPHPNKWDKTGSIVEVRQHDQYAIKIDGSGRITLRNRKFLRKFSPVHYDRPTRSIYDDLATRVTGLTPIVTPQLPNENDPATPTGHIPPPTVTSARTPQRKTAPDAFTPTTPGRVTPRRPILQTTPPAPDARAPDTTSASPPSEPDVEPPAPAIGQRRSTRATSVPTWHKDYSMG